MVMVLSEFYYECCFRIHYADEIATCGNFFLKNDPFFRIPTCMVAVLSVYYYEIYSRTFFSKRKVLKLQRN